MTDDQRLAWAYLARVAEPPSAAVMALITEFGPVAAAEAIRERSVPESHASVLEATEARHATDAAERDNETAERIGARLVTPVDEEWPGWSLMSLAQADTSVRGGEPLALWVRGPARLDELSTGSIALVGSRAASSYGEYVGSMMAGGLVASGWAVVSGGAYGIDGVAHRAALAADGVTAAVMACGIDRAYPSGHAALLNQVAERGALISEYPPGTTAAKHRFLTRNRLVAAMSEAVVVIEAGRRSGAANTAAWARKLHRPLAAVPGPVTSATSVGCHRMISDGLATLVTDADGVIAVARPDGGGDVGRARDRPTDELTDDQKRTQDAIPARGVVTTAEIAFSAGLDVAAVRAALAVLEIKGLAVADSGAWRLTRR